MKITTSLLFLFVNLKSAFAAHQLSYELPNRTSNWIGNVYLSDDITVVSHAEGISVSYDRQTFFEAHIPDLHFHQKHLYRRPHIFVSKFHGTIMLSYRASDSFSRAGEFISHDGGRTFLPLIISQNFLDIESITEDRFSIYANSRFHISNEAEDDEKFADNKFYRSKDKGKTWQEVIVDKNNYSLTLMGLHVVDDKLLFWKLPNYEKWPLFSWDDEKQCMNLELEDSRDKRDEYFGVKEFNTQWQTHNTQVLPPYKTASCNGTIVFSYPDEPRGYVNRSREIGIKAQNTFVSTDDLPRVGGFIDNDEKKLYYATFLNIWVWE